jgi:hypothetical protein
LAAEDNADAELIELGRQLGVLIARYKQNGAQVAPLLEEHDIRMEPFMLRFKRGELSNAEFMREYDEQYEALGIEQIDERDGLTDAMDVPMRRIMALPATSLPGLAVKAMAAAHACSHFFGKSDEDADWDHLHARGLIQAVLALANYSAPQVPRGLGEA